jgi:hypothetical protein
VHSVSGTRAAAHAKNPDLPDGVIQLNEYAPIANAHPPFVPAPAEFHQIN